MELCRAIGRTEHGAVVYCTRPAGHEPAPHIAAIGPAGSSVPILATWRVVEPQTPTHRTDASVPTPAAADVVRTFTAHSPAYVDGFDKGPVRGTLAEILADPWVANWTANDFGHLFDRWMVAPYTADSGLLIYTADGGRFWWVVGYVTPAPIDLLPMWQPPSGSPRR